MFMVMYLIYMYLCFTAISQVNLERTDNNWKNFQSKVLLPACPCWQQLTHLDQGETLEFCSLVTLYLLLLCTISLTWMRSHQRWSAICCVWPWTLTYQKFLLCVSSQGQDLYSHQKINMYIYWFSSESGYRHRRRWQCRMPQYNP